MKAHSTGAKMFSSLLGIVLILLQLTLIGNLSATDKYPLKIDSTGKYITEQDGTPYFTVLDTAWFLNLLPREDIDLYMNNRKAKGFNTIYMNIIHPYTSYQRSEADGTGNLDEYGRLTTTTVLDADGIPVFGDAYGNQPFGDMLWCRVGLGGLLPDYWNHVQYILDKAKALDMQMWMVVARAARYNGYNNDADGIARMEAYIQKLVERFPEAEYPNIVWILGGDKKLWDSDDLNLLMAMAKEFKTLGDTRLISFHPGVTEVGFSVQFNDAADAAGEWLDFYQLQTCHSPLSDGPYKDMATILAHSPRRKPVIISELLYENIGNNGEGDEATAVNVRGQVYQGVFSGGSGIGYGANGVWNAGMAVEYRSGYPASADEWRTAMDDPGAYQMVYCKKLLEAYPWYEAGPDTDDEIISADDRQLTSGTYIENHFSRAPALIADNRAWALIYFPDIGWDENRVLSVLMNKFSTSSIKAKWFDPSSGEYSEWFATYSNVGTVSFTAPGKNNEGSRDWVLVLDGRSAVPQNEAPTANAGADQSITFPVNSVTLAGTVSDDGLPNSTLTSTWAKVSGAGAVTFANASDLNTTAEFSTSGTYVLRLTASDGELQNSSDITITFNSSGPDGYIWCANESGTVNFTETVDVAYGLNGSFNYLNGVTGSITFDNSTFGDPLYGVVKKGYYRISAPANQAPVVNAGADQNITLPTNSVSLNGTVTDDGLPDNSLATTWAQVSGPGTVVFGNTAAVDTSAQFNAAGTYVLRLTADDGNLTTSDDVTVTVSAAPTSDTSGITREVWFDIPGNDASDLTASVNYPNNPDESGILTSFQSPANIADNYGQRIHGYIVPPTTGEYTFWIAGDNQCLLYLSTDGDPANTVQIADVPGWTSQNDFTAYSSQESSPVLLQAGVPYYILALNKEGYGGDGVAVAWEGPGISQQVIPGEYLAPAAISEPVNTGEILANPQFEGPANEESFPYSWTHQYNELATYNLRNDISFEEGNSVLEIDNPQEGTVPVSIKSSSFNLPVDVVTVEASVWAEGSGNMKFIIHATDWSLPTEIETVTIDSTWQKYTVILDVPAHIADQGFNFRIDCDGKGEISLAHPSLQSIN